MASTVFILGAGASHEAGAPLMWNFLDAARDLFAGTELNDPEREAFATVFKAVGLLQRAHSKAIIDIVNIEAVFAALEMAQTLGGFGDFTADQVKGAISSMKTLILETIARTVKYPLRGARGELLRLQPPQPYGGFAEILEHLHDLTTVYPDIITFNYDIGIDFALQFKGLPHDYGLRAPVKEGVGLYKLHGSVHWPQSDGEIRPTDISGLRSRTFSPVSEVLTACLSARSYLPPESEPFIVPPTFSKAALYQQISMVWSCAAQSLAEAENIIVIGYSLPDSDMFFRYLYALGTVGHNPLRRFWVFDPETKGTVERRFRELLGPGAQQRFEYFPLTFRKSIRILAEGLLKQKSVSDLRTLAAMLP